MLERAIYILAIAGWLFGIPSLFVLQGSWFNAVTAFIFCSTALALILANYEGDQGGK